jgi:hypothetical protein
VAVSGNRRKRRKGWKTGRLHWPGSRHEGHDHAGMEERLKPLEETKEFKESPQAEGKRGADTIRVDSKSVRMPEQFAEDEREGANIFRLEPVVLFILLVMLAFIAFVAWQITLMPAKQ